MKITVVGSDQFKLNMISFRLQFTKCKYIYFHLKVNRTLNCNTITKTSFCNLLSYLSIKIIFIWPIEISQVVLRFLTDCAISGPALKWDTILSEISGVVYCSGT